MNLGSLIKEFKEPQQLFMKVIHRYPELFKWMDDELYLKFFYRIVMGKKLNLDNPQTFNEKLQWLKLHDRKDIYTIMVDKYEAKKYVAEHIGEEYIIPTLGVWDSFDDIDFDSLPNQFVLKCTHDSGGLVVCRDKSTFDKNTARKKINRSMKSNFFWFGREWPYKNVKPRIIAEKYMEDTRSSDLKDYKFFCFGGMAKCYKVDFDRFKEHHANYFDANGKLLPFGERICPPLVDRKLDTPKNMEEMRQLAEKLSSEVPFLRADFYDVDGKNYFGELTFFPASGFGQFTSDEWDQRLGKWIPIGGRGHILKNRDLVFVFSNMSPNSSSINDYGCGLKDYKLYCFSGKMKLLLITQDRNKKMTTGDYFDENGNHLDMTWGFPNAKTVPEIPKNFSLMKKLAEALSTGMTELRVDFYNINDHVYFGELTFYDGSGFERIEPEHYNKTMGDWIDLPLI